jgi:hypothetical protein
MEDDVLQEVLGLRDDDTVAPAVLDTGADDALLPPVRHVREDEQVTRNDNDGGAPQPRRDASPPPQRAAAPPGQPDVGGVALRASWRAAPTRCCAKCTKATSGTGRGCMCQVNRTAGVGSGTGPPSGLVPLSLALASFA